MKYNDPQRPQTPAGRPMLLVDGSAVPMIVVDSFGENQVQLGVMLRNYNLPESHAYSWFNAKIDYGALTAFFHDYFFDPELTLKLIFGWEPQARSPRSHLAKPLPLPKAVVPEALRKSFGEMKDLL